MKQIEDKCCRSQVFFIITVKYILICWFGSDFTTFDYHDWVWRWSCLSALILLSSKMGAYDHLYNADLRQCKVPGNGHPSHTAISECTVRSSDVLYSCWMFSWKGDVARGVHHWCVTVWMLLCTLISGWRLHPPRLIKPLVETPA